MTLFIRLFRTASVPLAQNHEASGPLAVRKSMNLIPRRVLPLEAITL
jgi:hypothetical protein